MSNDLKDKTAGDFDKEYMRHMVKGHKEALKLFTQAAKELKNVQLREFANKTADTIREHLQPARAVNEKLGQENAVRTQKQGGATERSPRPPYDLVEVKLEVG